VERTRVIIADDESLIRMDLREMLTNLGYLVVGEVGDGRSAVNLAREVRPDIIIMDIKMPDMDGIEAAKVLTEERIAPVLLLSAYSQQELVQRARQAGVAGYLVKPFRESDLTPAIEVAHWRASASSARWSARSPACKTRWRRARPSIAPRAFLMDTQGLTETEAFRKHPEDEHEQPQTHARRRRSDHPGASGQRTVKPFWGLRRSEREHRNNAPLALVPTGVIEVIDVMPVYNERATLEQIVRLVRTVDLTVNPSGSNPPLRGR
jgi:AmiR/NasT family two-component response regulator